MINLTEKVIGLKFCVFRQNNMMATIFLQNLHIKNLKSIPKYN